MTYPQLQPAHPLYSIYCEGWPDWTEEEAWRAAITQAPKQKCDSKSHPAYAADYIRNDTQERERAHGQTASSKEGGQRPQPTDPEKPRR